MYALVDCNSFYASCEQIFRPDLRGQPVVVLSNNDGCIVARSKEAKNLGIPDLQPFFKIAQLLRQKGVHVFSSNYCLYGDISHKVMSTLQNYSPDIEVYSIDEMFLCLAGVQEPLIAYGQTIKQTVWRDIRMPVSVGMAPTKTLAKLANHAAKKIPKTQGVCLLDSPLKWQWLQKRLPVTKVWGIGKRLGKRLNAMDISTVYDLATANAKQLRQQFSVDVERIIAELNGNPAISLELQPAAKKQIFCTRSFGEKPTELKPLAQAISAYAARACEKLRAQKQYCKSVQVFINTSPYDANYYSQQLVVQLPYPTDDSRIIIAHANKALAIIYKTGKCYLKAGVGLLDLSERKYMQQDLFQRAQTTQCDALMLTVDKINRRYGQGLIYWGAEGSNKRWHMRQQFLSPAYTTRWEDIPFIKC